MAGYREKCLDQVCGLYSEGRTMKVFALAECILSAARSCWNFAVLLQAARHDKGSSRDLSHNLERQIHHSQS